MARVLISMKEEFLKRIDEVAEAEQRSRSELIREALRMYIRKTPAQPLSGLSANATEPTVQ